MEFTKELDIKLLVFFLSSFEFPGNYPRFILGLCLVRWVEAFNLAFSFSEKLLLLIGLQTNKMSHAYYMPHNNISHKPAKATQARNCLVGLLTSDKFW